MNGYSGIPQSLAVCPTDENLLACASSTGLFASADAGLNWYRVTSDFGGANDLVQTGEYSFDIGLLIATEDAGVWLWDWSGTPPYQVFGAFEQSKISCVEDFAMYDQCFYAGTSNASAWRHYYGLGINEDENGTAQNYPFGIYPNPAEGSETFAVVKLSSPATAALSIFDISGRLVNVPYSGRMETGEHSIPIDLSTLAPGIYFATLSTDNETVSVKFLIMD